MSILNNGGCLRVSQPNYYIKRTVVSSEYTVPTLKDCDSLAEYAQRMHVAAKGINAHSTTIRANEIEIYAAIQLILNIVELGDNLTPFDTAFTLRQHFNFYSKNNNMAICAVSEALRRLEEVGAVEKIRVYYQPEYSNYPTGYREAYRVINLDIDVPPEY